MSLDGQSILSEYKSLVRGRAVAWDAYVRYNVVTESDVRAIKAADKVPAARRAQLLHDDPETYARLILGDTGVVRKSANVDRIDLVQWMLMWTGDLLEGEFRSAAAGRTGRVGGRVWRAAACGRRRKGLMVGGGGW